MVLAHFPSLDCQTVAFLGLHFGAVEPLSGSFGCVQIWRRNDHFFLQKVRFSLNSATLCFTSCNSAATFFSLNLALELHCFRAADLFLVSFVVSPQQPSVLMLEGHAHHAAVNSGLDDLDSSQLEVHGNTAGSTSAACPWVHIDLVKGGQEQGIVAK